MHTPQARCGRSLATFLGLQAVICQALYLRTASLAALTIILPCSSGAFALAFGLARCASREPDAARQHGKSLPLRAAACSSLPTRAAGLCSLVPRGEPLPPGRAALAPSHARSLTLLFLAIQAQYRRVVHHGS